jgi:hypothetical protein
MATNVILEVSLNCRAGSILTFCIFSSICKELSLVRPEDREMAFYLEEGADNLCSQVGGEATIKILRRCFATDSSDIEIPSLLANPDKRTQSDVRQ